MSIAIKDLKIAVLAGGIGSERQVSIDSGKNIAKAISQAGLKVITSDITPDDLSILDDNSIDVFFSALHGEFGEDGQLQQILEDRNLLYVGSGPEASRLAFDKIAAKKVFRNNSISVPWELSLAEGSDEGSVMSALEKNGQKFVIKPIKQGSSVGVEIVNGCGSALHAGKKCLSEFGDCMIEEFIEGADVTVGILNGRELPVIEIRSKREFYDYQAKYLDEATGYLFDTIDDKEVIAKINRSAIRCFELLGCRHLARIDMVLADNNTPYVLEVNTLPGFTEHSLLPMAANKAGLSSSQLCIEIIEAALQTFKGRV